MEEQSLNKEMLIDKLLVFMQSNLESHGRTPRQATFDFSLQSTLNYFNAESKVIPTGNDLTLLRKTIDFDDEKFKEIINICLSRGYIKPRSVGGVDYQCVSLTEEGQGRAISTERAKDYINKANNTVHITGNVNAPIQIGDNNIQNFISYISSQIDKSKGSETEKVEAKHLLNKVLENPLISSLLSGIAIEVMKKGAGI